MLDKTIQNRIEQYSNMIEELTLGVIFSFKTTKPREVPSLAGVYAIYNNSDDVIYVGTSKNMKNRIFTNHKNGNMKASSFRVQVSRLLRSKDEYEIKNYIVENCRFRVLSIEDNNERYKFEHFAIGVLNPELND